MSGIDQVTQESSASNTEERGIIAERDQAVQDLRDIEQAFSDVHTKYERAKQAVQNFKANEEVYKKRDREMHAMVCTRNQKYKAFKQETSGVLDRMCADYQGKIDTLGIDNNKISANLRRSEMRCESLQFELHQKQEENKQLNTLVDELIEKGTF